MDSWLEERIRRLEDRTALLRGRAWEVERRRTATTQGLFYLGRQQSLPPKTHPNTFTFDMEHWWDSGGGVWLPYPAIVIDTHYTNTITMTYQAYPPGTLDGPG